MAAVTQFPGSAPKASLLATLDNLQALLDTLDLVKPQDELEFSRDLANALAAAKDKTDKVSGYWSELEALIMATDVEIDRLQIRKARLERGLKHIRDYVARCVRFFGKDERGKYRKLEGNTSTLAVEKCPPSVIVDNLAAVPTRYKRVSLTMPAETWAMILAALPESMDPWTDQVVVEESADKRLLNPELKLHPIPGARLEDDKYTAVRQ